MFPIRIKVYHCLQCEERASPGFQLRKQFWLISENWVTLKADPGDSCGVFGLNLVYHTSCSSRQIHKSGDAAWRSPAGQVTVPFPKCSSPRKWHGVCYGPKRAHRESSWDMSLDKIIKTIRKIVIRSLGETYCPEGPLKLWQIKSRDYI